MEERPLSSGEAPAGLPVGGEAEDLRDRVFASVPSGLALIAHDLRIVSANPSFCMTVGVDDPAGRRFSDLLPGGELTGEVRVALANGNARRDLDLDLPWGPDGPGRAVRASIIPVPGVADGLDGVLVVLEDKTEAERYRASALENERRLQDLVEHAADAVVLVDQSGKLTYLNVAAERMFGYRRDELMGADARIILPEGFFTSGDRHNARRAARGELPTKTPVRAMQACRKDGTALPVEGSLSAWAVGGAVTDSVVYAAVLRDVSIRRKAEEALRRSEQSFRALIENSPDGVGIYRDGRWVYTNQALVGILQYEKADDLAGRSVLDAVHADDREVLSEKVRQVVITGGAAAPHECRLLRADGQAIWVEIVALSVVYDGAPAVVLIARDTNDRRLLQMHAAQVDRMLSVGTLAAGVAHEINNPLTYVISNLGFIARELESVNEALKDGRPADESLLDRLAEARTALGEVRDGADRVRLIVRDLKTFSRSDEEHRGRIVVARAIDSAVLMTRNEWKVRARLEKEFDDVPPVEGNEGRLGQVFVNLIMNAAHAIPERGGADHVISVATRRWPDGRVCVEVRDSGVGIPRENLSRVFDPFFTTKPVGEGTGLGLSVCMGIVTQMGGEIAVESEVGKGSTFRVLLPAAELEGGSTGIAMVPDRTHRRGRVLVVDDEPQIGTAVQRALKDEHEVHVSHTAGEALRRLMNGDDFELILCDLMMPEMSGMDFHASLERMLPGVAGRVVFLTGGAYTARAKAFLDQVANARFDKPFEEAELKLFVRDRLG